MPATSDKLRLLLRAELLRGRIAARVLAVRAGVYGAAVLVAVLGVVMLVIAANLALSAELGPIYGALVTGAGLVALAVLLVLVARPLSRSRNARVADDLERAIRGDIMQDVQAAEASVRQLERAALRLGSGLGGGPVSLLAFGLGLAAAVSPRLRRVLFSLLR